MEKLVLIPPCLGLLVNKGLSADVRQTARLSSRTYSLSAAWRRQLARRRDESVYCSYVRNVLITMTEILLDTIPIIVTFSPAPHSRHHQTSESLDTVTVFRFLFKSGL